MVSASSRPRAIRRRRSAARARGCRAASRPPSAASPATAGPGSAAPGTSWTVWDNGNSPIAGALTSVAVDVDGSVWAGTWDAGLYRFDGVAWTHYDVLNSGLSDNYVTSIEIDPSGNKWIGVWSEGVDRFDGTTWTNFSPGSTAPPGGCAPGCGEMLFCAPDELGLISTVVKVLAVDEVSGDVWLRNEDDGPCALRGVSHWDGTRWRTYTEQNSGLDSNVVEGVDVGPLGEVWITGPNGTSRLTGTVWDTFAQSGEDVEVVGSDVWFGTGLGLVRYDGTRFETVPSGSLARDKVHDIAVDPASGEVWLATGSSLQRKIDDDWETWDQSNTPLPTTSFRAALVAADGSLWAGLKPGGAARFDGTTWTSWDSSNSNICTTNITTMMEDGSGHIWVSWEFALTCRYDGSTWIWENQVGGVYDMVRAANGDLWFATNSGAKRFDGTSWVTFTTSQGLVSNLTRALAAAANGDVWIGTTTGLSQFDGTSFTTHTGVGDDDIMTISVDAAGNVWVGTRGGGVGRYDGSVWEPIDYPATGLVFGRTLSSAADPIGPVYIGTEFGLSEFLGLLPGAPGEVADGSDGTTPVTVTKATSGQQRLTLSWEASCAAGAKYGVYRGALGDFTSHVPLKCDHGQLSYTFNQQPGSAYFLVTSTLPGFESSYGEPSKGRRPASASPCEPEPLHSICP